MLHQEAVETSTLELIKSLQSKPYLDGFYLVGGTALSLVLGHRKSLDIDLFSNFDFDAGALMEKIHRDYPYNVNYTASNTLKGNIGVIEVDLLAHRYKYIKEPVIDSGIQLLSLPDIIAMKLNAIATSGQRTKDFIDIYYLLDKYDIGNMLSFYLKKYQQENDSVILKSLIYFDDIDLSNWPVIIRDPALSWNEVKHRLEKEVLRYARKQVGRGK
jgi:hypothetical protein